ncbi:MAG: mechanosensitive ion channel [Congregibacter sp.]
MSDTEPLSSESIVLSLQQSAESLLKDSIQYTPSLIAIIAVFIFGWLLARFFRSAAQRLLQALNRILETGELADPRLSKGAIALLSEAVFWLSLFLPLTIAARIASLPIVTKWLDQIVSVLPNLFIGVLIFVAGYLLSLVVRDQVETSARAANSTQSTLIGRFTQGTIFLFAAIIGLDQLGIDVTFLVALFAVVLGAVFVGVSIAFGLGSQDYVSNLLGARSLRRHVNKGLILRVGDVEGSLLEVTKTQIALDTAEGKALVPARLAEKHGVLIRYVETLPQETGSE